MSILHAIALTTLAATGLVFSTACAVLLARDLIVDVLTNKTRPRPCQARAHDPRGDSPREHR